MSARSTIFVLKLALSLSLLAFVFSQVPFEDIRTTLSLYTVPTILILVTLEFLALAIAAIRWGLLLRGESFTQLFRYTLVGQLYAFILPGQLTGDVVKTFRYISDRTMNTESVTSSVVVDKINGFLGVSVILLFGLYASTTTPNIQYQIPVIILVGVLIGIFLLGFVRRLQDGAKQLLVLVSARYPSFMRVSLWGQRIITAYGVCVQNKRALALNLLLACVFQLVSIAITMVSANALGIHVGLSDWCWIFGVISLAVAVPVTVAGVGVREGLFVLFLTQMGIAHEHALALSLSILTLQFFAAVLGGFMELWSVISPKRKAV